MPLSMTMLKIVRYLNLINCSVNRQVEFHEFKAIMKRAFLDMTAQPYYRFKNKLPMNMDYDPSRITTPEAWIESAVRFLIYVISHLLGLRRKHQKGV